MNRVWVPPPLDFVKINIFVATPVDPFPNGNSNGVGIIMRNQNGFLVWRVMGPVNDLTEFQTQLWAIHKGMKEAYSRGFFNTLIETAHVESFRILRRQNFEEASREGLVDAIKAINTCFPLLPCESEPICRVYTVSEARNQAARFAANYGMMHENGLVEVGYHLVGLRNLLDNDIGWGPNIQALETIASSGPGEVIQGSKPKKRKRILIEEADYVSLRDRVESLENHLKSMGPAKEMYTGIADPSFAFKTAQLSQGIKINVPGISNFNHGGSVLSTEEKEKALKDKGKGKMFEEGSCSKGCLKLKDVSDSLLQDDSKIHQLGSLLGDKKLNQGILVKEPAVSSSFSLPQPSLLDPPLVSLCQEAQEYVFNSVMDMIDPQLQSDELLSVDDVMLEFALFEEWQMKKEADDRMNKSG